MAIQTHIPMEMGRYLRQLVDNSFEEGQFEGAVATLDQLRSPDHRPSIIHILHLIFISLHSSTTSCRLDTEGIDATDDYNSLLKSPRKMVKAAKSALSLSPEAVSGAQRLLFSFLATNGPHALYAALPQYPESEAAKRQMSSADGGGGVQFVAEFVDSPIYAQAIAVKNARSVWEVIKEGFADRASTQAMGVNKGKARARPGLKTRGLVKEGTMGDLGDDEELKPVGSDSWTFLKWLVTLFEKDAEGVDAQGSVKHSSLLLRQLPPPPGGTNTRFDASEPLKVAFFALEQEDEGRQLIGLRLLQLLLDLTYCQYLNLSSLTGAVIAHLTAASEQGSSRNSPDSAQFSDDSPPSNPLTILLDLLPGTLATLPFKAALCQKILQDASGSSSSSSRPAPRARAAPPSSRGGKAANGNANEPSPGAPDLGINPATGRPLVSAMKKPGPKPRPRSNTVTTAPGPVAESSHADTTTGGAASSEALANGIPPPMAMAPSASGDSSVLTTASGSAAGAVPSAKPRPQLPWFADVAQAAKVQVRHAAEPRQTRHGGGAARQHGQSQTQTRTPWSAPSVLLRVRFELLLACARMVVLFSQQQRAADAPPPPLSAGSASGFATAGDEVMSEWIEAAREDGGRFAALIEQVFGSPRPGESESEKEDRAFYADVVRAHAGYTMANFGP